MRICSSINHLSWGVPSEGEAMTIETRGGHHSLLRFDTMNDLSQTG
jgi:hypothetical protein